MKYQVDDWVRFHRNGVLHIGVIEYARVQPRYPNDNEYVLSCGIVSESEVLEARRAQLEKG